MSTFEKNYKFEENDKIYVNWETNWFFKPDEKAINWNFFMPLPPPNVTWVLHIWHAQMLTIEDIMVRYNRMIWKKTLWIPWTDHAWIATQVVVERKLKKEKNLTRQQLWRVKFLEEVWKFVKESRSTIIKQSKKMWASLDWSKEQFTLSERNFRAVRKVFKSLYKKWKIYKWSYMTNWCHRCQTVLSDLEVNMKEWEWKLVYIKYFIAWKWDSITVATTRPETMFADVAIAVNPNDKRYKKYIWKKVQIPIVNREIPVIWDHDVDISFWTWALKITPTHDKADFEIAKRHNLPIELYAIDKDWKLTDICWVFAWTFAEKAVDDIIEHLDSIWNLEKVEAYTHNIPRCDRCDTLVQPLVSEQWFMDVEKAWEKSMEAIEKWEINVVPSRFNKTFYQWLTNLQPWCISRQLWWGHRIPVWTCENWHTNVFDEDYVLDKYKNIKETNWNVWLDMIIFNLIADSKLENPFNIERLIEVLYKDSFVKSQWKVYETYLSSYKLKSEELWMYKEELDNLENILNSVKSEDIDVIMEAGNNLASYLMDSLFLKPNDDTYIFEFKCYECESANLKQEDDTLDTWFSSGLWPFTVLWWPEKTKELEEYYPNTVLETWYDIIFFWIARMMIMWYEVMWWEKKEDFSWKPFENVYLHWLVRDEKWKKMSKSKWNVVDPLDKIQEYWADPLRLSLVLWTTPWNDLNFSDEKLDYNRRFINKLWNASRFVYNKSELDDTDSIDYNDLYDLLLSNKKQLTSFDSWILSWLDELINQVKDSMDKFYFWEAFVNVQKFVWNKFCDWYIEISKYDDGPFTPTVLLYAVWTILKLLHPVIPFVTETLWKKMKFDWELIISKYPDSLWIDKDETVDLLVDVIIWFRNLRNKNNIKPHEKLEIFINDFNNSKLLKYEDIIKRIVWWSVIFDDIEKVCVVDVVQNIKIWINLPEQEIDYSFKIQEIEKQIKKEEQFLQWIRKLLSSDWFKNSANPKVIEMKQKKKEEVENKILSLKEELARVKINMK